MGNLTDALHIPPQTADTAMKIILAYLLIGSYATLFLFGGSAKKPAPASASVCLFKKKFARPGGAFCFQFSALKT